MKQSQKETTMKKYLVAAAFLGAFALTTTSASAAVVCNDDGDCWKVKEKLTYPSDVHVQVYDDEWKWEGDKYRWRDPWVGRGYYRGGVWIGF